MGRCVLRRRRATRPDTRGAAAVEFALILPVLMLIVVGIINYGDMLSVRQSVSQAASEGARAAAVTTDSDKAAAGRKAVDDALAAQGQKCTAACSVTVAACSNEATKQCATVKVVIAYKGLIPGFGLILPNTLSYTAVARVS
jgi:Flp pilus assembly protein TadG